MRANTMKPRKMTSSFSKREKMRRNPFSRRNSRSTSLRRLSSSRSYAQGDKPGLARRPHRVEPQGPGKLAGLGPLIGPIHHPRQLRSLAAQATEQLAALRRIMGLARRQRDRHRRSSIRGNQMNLGVPPPAGLADGPGDHFFSRPRRVRMHLHDGAVH